MKHVIIFLLASLTMNSVAQIELKHGLLTSWGKGNISGLQHNIGDEFREGMFKVASLNSKYSYNAALGFRFRIKHLYHRLFCDADITLGVKKTYYAITLETSDKYDPEMPGIDFSSPCGFYISYQASLALSCNYIIYKGIYAGAGIVPSYRYRTEETVPPLANKFDMPVFAKIGYDFRFIDIAFSYQLGLTNMMQDKYIKQGRINDWQLQLFIPF